MQCDRRVAWNTGHLPHCWCCHGCLQDSNSGSWWILIKNSFSSLKPDFPHFQRLQLETTVYNYHVFYNLYFNYENLHMILISIIKFNSLVLYWISELELEYVLKNAHFKSYGNASVIWFECYLCSFRSVWIYAVDIVFLSPVKYALQKFNFVQRKF